MELGEKLKQARLTKNWSEEYIAEILGITEEAYLNFENGKTKPDLKKLEELLQILEINIDYKDTLFFSQTSETAIHTLSTKLIEQYEIRIKNLEKENLYLKSLLDRLMK
ncbi:MAG: helix-turn-helix transcriptional regulator [Cruoricaptor ignavus]|nr:helix-turn-helix transcriptional regulator [Cruoricaptor ignavus]